VQHWPPKIQTLTDYYGKIGAHIPTNVGFETVGELLCEKKKG
jgi:hypothetical protein